MKTQTIQHKRGTPSNWAKATNYMPPDGELIIYRGDGLPTQLKVGDGKTLVGALPFITMTPTQIEELVNSLIGEGGNGLSEAEVKELIEEALAGFNPPESGGGLTEDQVKELITAETAEINEQLTLNTDDIATLKAQMAEVLYEPIDIISFSVSPSLRELGSSVDSVTLNWKTNKIPSILTLDNTNINVNLTTQVIGGPFTATKQWKLYAADERGAYENAYTSITFTNNVYYGIGTEASNFDSNFITSLTTVLTTTSKYDFTVIPNDQYIYYAIPKGRGTVSFKVGGFEGGFENPETVSVINKSNYTEEYYVYRSTNKITGSTTVDVI